MEELSRGQKDERYFIGTLSRAKTQTLETLITKELEVLGGLAVPIIIITEEGLIKGFNKSAETEFGFSATRVIGKNVNIMMTRHHAKRHNSYLRSYLDTGKTRVIGKGRVVQVKCKDGTIKNSLLNVSVKRHEEARIFVGMLVVIGVVPEDKSSDEQ